MKYYKYNDEESEIAGGTTYIEVDDGWEMRGITVNGDRYIASNLFYPQWGMVLGEGRVDYDEINEVTEISKAEFDAVWNEHLVKHQAQWEARKRAYPRGAHVTGYIQIFYPQGVIINLGDGTLAVADHAACHALTPNEWMYTGHKVTGTVRDYDEVNHWLILDNPRVYDEQLPGLYL